MLRPLFVFPVVFAISACSGLGSSKPYAPKSPPEFRTAAASIMGRDVNNSVPESAANPNPRIRLKPSPGRAPLIGGIGSEVLESSNKSGAYIAFTGQVPVTQYFKIIGRADCDDWVYLQLVNPAMVRGNPNYYISGQYTGDKAALKCAGKFHEKFRDKSDDRLADSDGVIFDADSAVFTDVDGWSNGHRKLHMDGWAIKFVDPSTEDIKARLAAKPLSPIDVVQMKTVAYWIETHQAGEYAQDLRKLLPLDSRFSALNSWSGASHSILKALAAVEPPEAPVDVYIKIMEAGIVSMLVPGTQTTVAGQTVGEAPFIAANVLACRNQPGSVDDLEKVLTSATIRQHKLASAKALIAMGQKNLVRQKLSEGSLGDVSTRVSAMLEGRDPLMFACPYRNTPNDKS